MKIVVISRDSERMPRTITHARTKNKKKHKI